MSGEVGTYNLNIWEDRSLTKTFKITGIASASGYTAQLMIRASLLSTTALLTLTSSPAAGLTLSSDGTYLIIDVVITPTQATALALLISSGVWDFKITNPTGVVKSYVEGLAIVHQVTTHS